jgi:hypothetical protein
VARRKRKEEESGWTPPEFDEVEYMRKDIAAAKASVVTVGWAAVGALIAFGTLVVGTPAVAAFFIGVFAAVGLYYVMPFVGIRSDKFQRRDWAGHGMTYFFSWLAFWILLLNQPIGDFTNPTIHGITVGSFDPIGDPDPGPWTVDCVPVGTSSATVRLAGNTSLFVLFRATDNIGVPRDLLEVRVNGIRITTSTIESVDGLDHACASQSGLPYPAGSFVVKVPVSGSAPINIDIVARDVGGRTAHVNFGVTVVA